MPIVIIIIGLAIAIGVGGYFLRPQDAVTPTENQTLGEVPETVPEIRDAETVPVEANDDALTSKNVPPEPGDNPEGTLETSASEATTPEAAPTVYLDGLYNINTSYTVPNGANHTVTVYFTLNEDAITGADISFGGDEVATSKGYQAKFVAAYESQVIGKKLDSIKLSRVGGASLTSNAFNDAVTKVKVAARN